ncbi:DUF547 domain-containing protein [Dokdonia sp. Hel_I_53]|uniref:DUF547 domain-containing protein n=1 Tax=Dokdonia sp. Hel_I_53 TaxID=1566287 RepID=UPI00119B8019|nr:DUF547 domain-containing protein [Dokdonia sp. Hel_I_53]TVZ53079.1 uncharacterized protein DUF547 [Dokdonia sp. Hel_I_53]
MKITAYLIIITLLTECGTPKNVVVDTETTTPAIVTETVVDTSQTVVKTDTLNVPKQLKSIEVVVPANIKSDVVDNKIEEVIIVKTELPEAVEAVEAVEVVEVVEKVEVQEILPETKSLPNSKKDTLNTLNHDLFNALLRAHVNSNGDVNYNGFKKNWSKLTAYIANLGANLPTDEWSKNKKLAYWMNAYNAMTIDLILRHQPLESIKDIKNPWDQRFWKLGDKYYNLNEIEHDILRKMGDARIHFGINCASVSCPPLLNEAFTASKVNSQLHTLTTRFINDPVRNKITPDVVEISMIFKWFSKDFKTAGSVVDYLNKYANTKINPSARVRYKDYNWLLNN